MRDDIVEFTQLLGQVQDVRLAQLDVGEPQLPDQCEPRVNLRTREIYTQELRLPVQPDKTGGSRGRRCSRKEKDRRDPWAYWRSEAEGVQPLGD